MKTCRRERKNTVKLAKNAPKNPDIPVKYVQLFGEKYAEPPESDTC